MRSREQLRTCDLRGLRRASWLNRFKRRRRPAAGDVHALWAKFAGHRLGQDPLCRLGRRETGEAVLTPQRRRISRGNDGALTVLTIAGANRLARYSSPIVLTWKLRAALENSGNTYF
jgi:hypothetical protein